MVFKTRTRASVFGELGSVYLVPPYKGALCKGPFIIPLEWAIGEKRFHSSPLVIIPRHGSELKSGRKTLILLLLHVLNSALPCLIGFMDDVCFFAAIVNIIFFISILQSIIVRSP